MKKKNEKEVRILPDWFYDENIEPEKEYTGDSEYLNDFFNIDEDDYYDIVDDRVSGVLTFKKRNL